MLVGYVSNVVWDCKQLCQICKHVSYKLLNSTDTMHDAIKPRTTDSTNWYLSNKHMLLEPEHGITCTHPIDKWNALHSDIGCSKLLHVYSLSAQTHTAPHPSCLHMYTNVRVQEMGVGGLATYETVYNICLPRSHCYDLKLNLQSCINTE